MNLRQLCETASFRNSRLSGMSSDTTWSFEDEWDSSATLPAEDSAAVGDRFFAPVVRDNSLSTVPMCESTDYHQISEEDLVHYLNARLPPVDNVAPFIPLYASSPRPILDEVGEKAHHVEAEAQCLSALTTSPPPTLSLLGATDSFLADYNATVFPTPPCLSFYG
ncbi:unnamed protein product [Dicrocoelium dendriticum]|nr:unnamed protein product [Dicrocoelium dendriticum]